MKINNKLHSNRFILLVLVAIVLLSLTFFKQNSALCPRQEVEVVQIEDKGFDPPEMTVKRCTKVVFRNVGTNNHWSASDIHPTHAIYPEFDPREEIPPGREWSFVFNKEGHFRFHDHLFPNLRGVIIVTDGKVSSILKSDRLAEFEEIIKREGSVAAWEHLKKNASEVKGIHDVAHYIGSIIYKEKGLEKGLHICDSSFAFGCYHGLIEALISQEGIENLQKLVVSCQKLPKHQGELTCYHGMGHGILSHYKYDLPKALLLCDNLLETQYQQRCHSGVFMEFSLTKIEEFNEKNLQWPCNTVAEKYRSTCYSYQMIFLARLYRDDIQKIAQVCSQAGKRDYTNMCIRGLGHQITQRNITNPIKIRELCNAAGKDFSSVCLIASAEEFVFKKQPIEVARQEFCDSLAQPWQKECIERIELQKKIQ